MAKYNDYTLFHEFIRKYLLQGFRDIDRGDPWMVDMERKLCERKQFFYVGDLIQIKVHFASSGFREYFGMDPDTVGPGTMYLAAHPDQRMRISLARAKLFKTGHELFTSRKGYSVLSISMVLEDGSGHYSDFLIQGYSFYSEVPFTTVFLLMVITDISSFRMKRHGYHHYLGNDMAFFRYPNEKLLKTGHVFSDREFEILQLIAAGLDSETIASKLHLSVYTVNTHRRNMLKKTMKNTTLDIVIELMEKGIL